MTDDIRPPQTPKRNSPRNFSIDSLDTSRQRMIGADDDTPKEPVKPAQHRPPTQFHRGQPKPDLQPAKKKRFARFRKLRAWWKSLNRNLRFAIIAVLLLVFGAGATGYYYIVQPKSSPQLSVHKNVKPKVVQPTTVASPLTGVQVDPSLITRPVTGIMIENSPDARPQSGIDQAGVIFEAIAEGGITRFLTLYQEAQPQYVGPVRSLRPYYIDWLTPFDASIAHVGGSPEALSQIRSGGKDLDQFFNSGSYWRINSRPAPHNVYSSFERLDGLNRAKGYTSSKFTGFPRKADKKLTTPTAKSIDMAISSYYFNVHYDYNANANTYLRSEGGAPHRATSSEADKTGQQLHPNVVVALIIPYSIVDATGHSGYNSTGSGTVYVFQDGGVTQGTWTKSGRSGQFSFTDSNGAAIQFNAGQTWLSVLGSASMLHYAP